MKNQTKKLLPDILERIFKLLSKEDLCQVCLVCKRWNQIGSGRALWSKFRLQCVIQNEEAAKNMVLSPRFSKLFLNFKYLPKQTLISTPSILNSNISTVSITDLDMRYAMKELVILIPKLTCLTLTSCRMETSQAVKLFEALAVSPTMNEFGIFWPLIESTYGFLVGLSEVCPKLLVAAKKNVKVINFGKQKIGF